MRNRYSTGQTMTNKPPGFYSQLTSTIGHVLLGFLPAYILPLYLYDVMPQLLFTVDRIEFSNQIGLHVLLLHLLGWYRGYFKPMGGYRPLQKRIKNWVGILLFFSVLHLVALHFGRKVDISMLLDLLLMFWSYFNGILAAGAFSQAAILYRKS